MNPLNLKLFDLKLYGFWIDVRNPNVFGRENLSQEAGKASISSGKVEERGEVVPTAKVMGDNLLDGLEDAESITMIADSGLSRVTVAVL